MVIQSPKHNISFLPKRAFRLLICIAIFSLLPPAWTLFAKDSLPQSKFRIVSLNPAMTEILFDLDLGKYIVGTSSFSNFPVDAKKIPTVGSYLKPSIEKIIRLNPTHVLVFKEGDPSIEQSLKNAQLNYVVFESRSLIDFENMVINVGNIFNVTEKSKKLLREWKNQWSLIKSFPKVKKTIMIQIDHNPIFIAGGDTFLSEAFEKCGLKNVYDNLKGYKKIQIESALNRKPDIILVVGQLNEFDNYKDVKAFWQKIPITKNSTIVKGNANELSRLSFKLPTAIIKLCDEIKK